MKSRAATLVASLCCGASAAFAAPKLETVIVKPNPARFAAGKAPEVEIAVSISRSRFDTGSCDARVDFGDGQGRIIEFGVAVTRTMRHVYKKDGSYTIAVRGAGRSPCDGAQQTALTVAGEPRPKVEPKKESKKRKDTTK